MQHIEPCIEDLFMHFLRPVDVGSGDLPWTGLLTGMFIRYRENMSGV